MKTAKRLLDIARGELGYTESPAGSNRTKYGKWFGMNGYAWCMMFVMWVFAQLGVELPKRTASCGELMNAAKAAGCWVVRDFRPGDVVIYDFPGGAATDHCGIVEEILPDYVDPAAAASSGCAEFNRARPLAARYVQAIEGNTSEAGSQSNGGMVCRKKRAMKYIVGAVRPRFDEEESEMETRYNTMEQVPGYAKATVRKLVRMGGIRGSGAPRDQEGNPTDMDLSLDMIRLLVMNDQMGLYGE